MSDFFKTLVLTDSLCFTEGLEDLTVQIARCIQQALLTVPAVRGRLKHVVCALQQVLQQGELYQLQQPEHRLLVPHLAHNCENTETRSGDTK